MKLSICFPLIFMMTFQLFAQNSEENIPQQEELNWLTSFEEAKEIAESENKIIMMSFQGSDWCAACKKLEKILFQSEQFTNIANSKLVLLKLDFPMKKKNKLSEEQTIYNEQLAEEYNPQGLFPTVLFFNSDGTPMPHKLEVPKETLEEYMQQITDLVGQ